VALPQKRNNETVIEDAIKKFLVSFLSLGKNTYRCESLSVSVKYLVWSCEKNFQSVNEAIF